MTFKKFSKISRFSDVVHYLRHNDLTKPMEFFGTVKLHGTNAGIHFKGDDVFVAQSRNRIITPGDDNLGFASFAHNNKTYLQNLVRSILPVQYEAGIWVYGEWCGGSIQKGVALNKLPKQWVIFACKDMEGYVPLSMYAFEGATDDHESIFHITEVPTYSFILDVMNEQKLQDAQKYIEEETAKVDQLCPWAKKFGIEGIGEGIVWRGDGMSFKSKGSSHEKVAREPKVRVEVSPQIIKARKEFVETFVTSRRVEQGIEYLTEMGLPLDRSSTGVFMKWIATDIEAESRNEREVSNLDWKPLAKMCNLKARKMFFEEIDKV